MPGNRSLSFHLLDCEQVYALGCVMWEMANGGAAFMEDRTDAQV